MTPEEMKALQDGLKGSFDEMKKVNSEKLESEIKNLGISEIEAKQAKIDAEMDKVESKLLDEIEARQKADAKVAMFEKSLEEIRLAYERDGGSKAELKEDEVKAEAFKTFLRKGDEARHFNEEEFKALVTDSDPDGGYLMTPALEAMMMTYVFETSPMRSHADVKNISSNEMIITLDNDEASAGWVGEKEARTETTTPKFGQKKIVCNELYAEPRATQRAIDDAAWPLENWLAGKVAEKFGRTENAAYVNGNGVEKPRGFLTYPAGVVGAGIASQELIEQIASGGATTLTTDAFFDMEAALKSEYMSNAKWFLNRKTLGAVRKLKDGDGNYIWDPGFNGSQGPTILGKTFVRFEDMPVVGANALSIAFGDMKETYQILDRVGIRILRDPYTAKPFVKFYTTKRVGGDVKNFESLKLMKIATSV